jgi:oligoribonuclease
MRGAESHLIWIDLEMTGLDPERHTILEIASVVTDGQLEIVAEGPDIAVRHPPEVFAGMDEWSLVHHRDSGLTARAASSGRDLRLAEEETLRFLEGRCKRGISPLCGNSVWQDRRFLIKYMPRLESFFHYRNIDVSSVKELVRRWFPDLVSYPKRKSHQAKGDILESIGELRYYREHVFRRQP